MLNKVSRTFYKGKLILKNNAPTILTCVGAVGVVATAVTAVKATPKALELIDILEEEKGEELTKFETFKTAAPVYIPSVVIGVSTIACIFGANTLNKQKQAALMSAYALLDSSYKEYKDKVKELLGEEIETDIRESIMEDHLDTDIEVEDGKRLFYEECSGRYFEATKEQVLAAEYELNRLMTLRGYALLNDYYAYLGLKRTEEGEVLGWSIEYGYDAYGYKWIDFDHTLVTMDDGLECYIISMPFPPHVDYAYEI